MDWISVAGVTFAALFPLVNPLGALPLFASLTQSDTKSFRTQQAIKTAVYTFVILVVFEYAGNAILQFFGLSLGMLQIAGGLIVGHTGWNMSTGTPRVSPSEEKRLIHETKRRKHALSAMKDAVTAVPAAVEELGQKVVELPSEMHLHQGLDATSTPVDAPQPESKAESPKANGQLDISFSPMAMPMLAGPGAIGVVIGVTARNPGGANSIGIAVGILAIALLTLICLLTAGRITKLLGPSGIMAMQRIFGFIVLAIAVALIATGISALFGLQLHG